MARNGNLVGLEREKVWGGEERDGGSGLFCASFRLGSCTRFLRLRPRETDIW